MPKRNPIMCGRKFCTGCGRWRHVVDFACHTRDENGEMTLVAGTCRACTRLLNRETKSNYSTRLEIAEYNRVWQEKRRRRLGVLPREEWSKLNGRPIILGRTFCSRCGCWRPVSDFPLQKRGSKGQLPRLQSACYACARMLARENYRKRLEDPVRLAERREYDRIYKEIQRRKAGVPERQWGPRAKRGQPTAEGPRVPVEPLREWLESVIARETAPVSGFGSDRDLSDLARRLGTHERRLLTIRKAEYHTVGVVHVDAFLTRYGQAVRVNGFGPVERVEDLYPELAEGTA